MKFRLSSSTSCCRRPNLFPYSTRQIPVVKQYYYSPFHLYNLVSTIYFQAVALVILLKNVLCPMTNICENSTPKYLLHICPIPGLLSSQIEFTTDLHTWAADHSAKQGWHIWKISYWSTLLTRTKLQEKRSWRACLVQHLQVLSTARNHLLTLAASHSPPVPTHF